MVKHNALECFFFVKTNSTLNGGIESSCEDGCKDEPHIQWNI